MFENNIDFVGSTAQKTLGNYSPWISFFGTLMLFFFKTQPFLYIQIFIFGFIINILLNKFLKHIITDKRPKNDISNKNRMPSGHAQTTFYVIVFLSILLFKNKISGYEIKIWLSITILLGGLTVYNCIVDKYHTVDQIVIGILLGSGIGYGSTRYL